MYHVESPTACCRLAHQLSDKGFIFLECRGLSAILCYS